MKCDVHNFRRIQLTLAEWIDAWRIIPRVMVVLYMALVYKVSMWYMDLEPYVLSNCVPAELQTCVIVAPSNSHVAFVATVIGMAAAIFGLYTKSGETKIVPPEVADSDTSESPFPNKPTDDNY